MISGLLIAERGKERVNPKHEIGSAAVSWRSPDGSHVGEQTQLRGDLVSAEGRTDLDRPTYRSLRPISPRRPQFRYKRRAARRGNPSLAPLLDGRNWFPPSSCCRGRRSVSLPPLQAAPLFPPSVFLFPIPPSSHPLTHSQQKAHIFIPCSERGTDTGWISARSYEFN